MAYRRRVRNRKYRPRRRRRTFKRKWATRKNNQIHYFKRFVSLGSITMAAGSTETLGSLVFQLDDVPDFAEFKAMYDCFKINRVKLMFIPISNVSLYSTASTQVFINTEHSNRIFTVLDFNDETPATSVNILRQYGTCKMSPNNRIHKRYFKPRIQNSVASGTSQYIGWLSTDTSDDVKWFGVKYGITHQTAVGTENIYKVEAHYYLSFKQAI